MLSIVRKRKMLLMILLPLCLMVGGCSNLISPSPSWPTNLEVTELSDGGVCFSPDSAKHLAEFKADLEAW